MSKDKDKKLKDKKEKKDKKDKKGLKASKKKQKDTSPSKVKPSKASEKKAIAPVIFNIPSSLSENENNIEPINEIEAVANALVALEDQEEFAHNQELEVIAQIDADDDTLEVIDDKPQWAADLFQSEYAVPGSPDETIRVTCTQAVLLPYREESKLSKTQSLRLGRGFAMGMMNDSTCGALVGAIMLAGLSDASLEQTSHIYTEFQKRYGSTLCKDILEGPSTCRDIIKYACSLYEKIALGKDDPVSDSASDTDSGSDSD